jgi:hypothetical protein
MRVIEATNGALYSREMNHFWNGQLQCPGHFLAGHISGSEDEFTDRVLFESRFFQKVIADTFVARISIPDSIEHGSAQTLNLKIVHANLIRTDALA